jgi:hypothetical protein
MPPMNSAVSRSESGWSRRKSRLADVCSQRIELLLLLLLAGCSLNTPSVAQARIKRWMRREASTQLLLLLLLLLLLQPVTA